MADVTAIRTWLSEDPLDVTQVIAEASSIEAGGIGIFIGTVRASASVESNSIKSVVRLDYEAHPTLAIEKLQAAAEAAAAKFELIKIAAVHRTGRCELGEPTVAIACAAAHRGEALDAARFLIDEIKATVPIWKSEVYGDGSAWVGATP
ncbi:MAG: molybdenum cofactor biosynthesis protein MoaE [Actinobacteria bacterium]|nr:molybdenum cofactor biosynthesis protein MoaE [Actinomycetota bacterium]